MTPRTRETISLALISLVIVGVIVGFILLIFWVSGHQDLLSQMLQSTAKGELFGVAFTAGGPFGMWIIAFILLRYAIKGVSLGPIKLFLRFPAAQGKSPPSRLADFRKAKCWYSIRNGSKIVERDKKVQILSVIADKEKSSVAPYIYVKAPIIENPLIEVRLEYEGKEWLSDSYPVKEGDLNLQ